YKNVESNNRKILPLNITIAIVITVFLAIFSIQRYITTQTRKNSCVGTSFIKDIVRVFNI
ncbi:hypothetical protein, partial [Enterococcus faecium]|uniref:hypothetical protein n=1 Tax=Enterococcus faecium TaxID=1352 RepID=UPI001C60E259